MAKRTVTKELIGIEDILTGLGTVTQDRVQTPTSVTKVNAYNLAYSGDGATMKSIGTAIDEANSNTSQGNFDTLDEYTTDAGITIEAILLKDGELSTNVIHERTNDTGVTIDSVLLKDNAITATNITVTNEVRTDTIVERVADAGVTIENVLLKDGRVSGLGNSPEGAIIAWMGGYFQDGSNGTFTNVLGNTIANANAYLNPLGWWVCDGSAINDAVSSIWNAVSRYLPNLTDERFLQGNTSAGSIGGTNVMLDHTHTPGTLSVSGGNSTSGSWDGTSGAWDGTSGGMSANESHTHEIAGFVVEDSQFDPDQAANYTMDTKTSQTFSAGNTNIAHTHTIPSHTHTIPSHTHSIPSHSHSLSGTVGTGSVPSSTQNRPSYLSCFYIVRVK